MAGDNVFSSMMHAMMTADIADKGLHHRHFVDELSIQSVLNAAIRAAFCRRCCTAKRAT